MHTEATLWLASTHDEAVERFRDGWQGSDFDRVVERGLIGTPSEIIEKVSAMQEEGLSHLIGIPGQVKSFEEWLEQVQIFGEEVVSAFK